MKTTVIGQCTVLHAQGRFDGPRGAAIARRIGDIAPRTAVLCLDFSDVDFIDSAGLGKLVSAVKVSRQNACRLILCHLSAQIQLILEIAQLERVFEIYDTYEEVQEAINPENESHLSVA
ncbi:STAS domain-containing protein [Roseofilum casamattae]|uniref:Anti-sigma factor antagonist n=1 Tax=Roseofilum casamattae BLCC-M143 TaxID=3022442 RepID=A0ABT7BXS8_9CYAN|nr:STAS domain-containing protein [Roseofilum casamattae]MDJ1184007.1 STAS domain-containing protein [Roseofilum casamattae BLCC-M143]